MDIGSLFLILALLILVVLFVSRPFFEQKTNPVNKQDHELSTLLAEKDATLTALRELEFDYVLGKIPEETYPAQRALLVRRGVDVLQRLDNFQGQTYSEETETRLEAAVAARRNAQPAAASPSGNGSGNHAPDDQLEALIAARRRNRSEKAVGFCPQCGGPLQQSDRFCPKCGVAVK
jgi:hypothetical protein